MNSDNNLFIKGARVNNLKNIDIEIPREKFVVITGLSGSGKSSLAFDTLYAEGQRRYVESLSSYARQFLGRMSKPECDFIHGIPPAIAIEQKVTVKSPRSTVGTSTEIYDYLRMLFARIGKTYSPLSGNLVKKHTTEDVINTILTYPERTKLAILIPVTVPSGRTLEQQLEILLKSGFNRLEINGEFERIEDILKSETPVIADNMFLVIDRLSVSSSNDTISRMTDSIEVAFYEGNNRCIVKFYTP